MKKRLLISLSILILAAGFAAAQTEADDAYRKATTQSDPCQEYQLLKDFVAKYAGKASQYEHYAYSFLSLTKCPSAPVAERITFGEKALGMSGLDDVTKVRIQLTIAQLAYVSGEHSDKGKSRANEAIALSKTNRDKDPGDAQWTKFIGLGHLFIGMISEKSKNYKEAAEEYYESYGILKDPSIKVQINKMVKTLYDAKKFNEAEQIFRAMYNESKDPDILIQLGQTLYKNNKTEEALDLYKEAYSKKKTGGLAYNIGIIAAKKNPQDGIDYLLEASFLYPSGSAEAQNCLAMAQGLFFSSGDSKVNDVITKIQEKDKKLQETVKKFNTKFGEKNEEDLTDAEKAEVKSILAEIEAMKAEIAQLQNSNKEITAKWAKRMEEVKRKLGSR